MIDFMAEESGNIVGVRATEKLTAAEYRQVLAPRIDSLLGQFHTLKVLFLMDENFRGWSLGAGLANTAFDWKHRRDFEKIAIVGAPKWEEWCVRAPARLLMNGEIRTFHTDQLSQAWAWLSA